MPGAIPKREQQSSDGLVSLLEAIFDCNEAQATAPWPYRARAGEAAQAAIEMHRTLTGASFTTCAPSHRLTHAA